MDRPPTDDDFHWYKHAVIYEIHVRAFFDSNGDGIGDFKGLIQKLDYLRDLGVTALWLLPFYPSPLRDSGYDIADYTAVHPAYGTLADFERFLDEAHRRGLRVITELVLNHTSIDHAWFQRARHAPPGSPARDFYVWSNTPAKFQDARVIFKDFESSNWSWDPIAGAYYWHRFYAHQPDLNYDNPTVGDSMLDAVDFWLSRGVDGLRLDAVPYLYERQGTNCENLPETHAFLRRLRAHVDERWRNRMLLAEANQWPEDAVAYFGDGDECHMNFHFPLMPRMFMSLHLEDRFPIVDILRQTPPIPEHCQWATFLRNHDELTLEMVTDEDRDYMYRVYAEDPNARINLGIRRRLSPLVKSRAKVELMNGLLFSLPGTPVLYYGDEIGMGDNIYLGDRDGVRTPMQWSADRNAGFSSANPQRLYLPVTTDPEYHYEVFNVQANEANPNSLLWWMKRMIDIRKQHPEFGDANIEFLQPENTKILAFIRALGETRVLVVANLSRYPQYAPLDLSALAGLVPVEMFGNTRFPIITTAPYTLTLAPHGFYWFHLHPQHAASDEPPSLTVRGDWTNVFAGAAGRRLESAMARYVEAQRWFRSKARTRVSVHVVDRVALPASPAPSLLTLWQFSFATGESEVYAIPLAFASGDEARVQSGVIASLRVEKDGAVEEGVLFDTLASPLGGRSLSYYLDGAAPNENICIEALGPLNGGPFEPKLATFEQSNSAIVLGDKYLLKVYRRLEAGLQPEIELGLHLKGHPEVGAPHLSAALRYSGAGGEATLATIQELVANEGSAWTLTVDAVERFCERVFSNTGSHEIALPTGGLVARSRQQPENDMRLLLGEYLTHARQLGARVATMHIALASDDGNPAFAVEKFTSFYQRSLYQSVHAAWTRASETLQRRLSSLNDETRTLAHLALSSDVHSHLRRITAHRLDAGRMRIHGDLHLGQVLRTGSDFVIIDFEGEPGVPLNERRYKRNALRDVAGMLRSFHYATESALRLPRFVTHSSHGLRPWVRAWNEWVGAAFLDAYLTNAGDFAVLPSSDADKERLLSFYVIQKAIYEINYELNSRPDWLDIPLRGLVDQMSQ